MSVRFFYFKTNPGFDSITEKRRINAIVKSNITSPSPVQARIYYNLTKLEQLLKRKQAIDLSLKHHVVYQYSCPHSGCNTSTYIGFTQNTILERMRQHKYNGSIKEHLSLSIMILRRIIYPQILQSSPQLARKTTCAFWKAYGRGRANRKSTKERKIVQISYTYRSIPLALVVFRIRFNLSRLIFPDDARWFLWRKLGK